MAEHGGLDTLVRREPPPLDRVRRERADTGGSGGSDESGGGGGLGRNPALDGLRALAVLCVLVFHMDALPGGYLGVDVFFVLSGFLITGQLLAERDRAGEVSLIRFYVRRAYRLLPAFWLLALVGLVAVVTGIDGRAGALGEFLGSLAASAMYVNNYVQVVRQSTGAGWLGHTWSLSAEEQFYLLWPPVLVALCRRPRLARRLPVVLLAGVAAVALWRNVLAAFGASATRMYFGLDTRADTLLVGCALAAWLRAARPRPTATSGARAGGGSVATVGVATVGVDGPAVAAPGAWRRGLDRITGVLPAVGTVAFALLAVATVIAPSGWGPRATSMCRGGYTVVALLAGAVVLALTQAGPTTWLFRALAVAPLAWLGRISYGFYLWHFPVVAHWGPGLTGALGRWPAILAAGLLSVVLAAASYYLVERPILRRCPRWSRPSPAGSGGLASAPAPRGGGAGRS